MADLPKFARLGDSIQCEVRYPFPQTLTMRLATQAATAHANRLLSDPESGWRIVRPAALPNPETNPEQAAQGGKESEGWPCAACGSPDACNLLGCRNAAPTPPPHEVQPPEQATENER